MMEFLDFLFSFFFDRRTALWMGAHSVGGTSLTLCWVILTHLRREVLFGQTPEIFLYYQVLGGQR